MKKIVERRKNGNYDMGRTNLDDAIGSQYDSKRRSFRQYFRYLLVTALVLTALTVFYFVDSTTHVTSLRSAESFFKTKPLKDESALTLNTASLSNLIEQDIAVEATDKNEVEGQEESIPERIRQLESEEAIPWKSKGRIRTADMGGRNEEAEEEEVNIGEEDDDDDDSDDESKEMEPEGKIFEEEPDAKEEEEHVEEDEERKPQEGNESKRRKAKAKGKSKFTKEHKLIEEVHQQIEKIRHMKDEGTVMEISDEAKVEIAILQDKLRVLLKSRYGSPPYMVEMKLQFPESMAESGPLEDKIIFELAPIELVPYSVYFFLEVIKNWKGGSFHRNAGHVLQAMVKGNQDGLAFQEYHQDFPHIKYTMGYAGRPGGPAFYISTQNNKWNHGPGSQGSKTEADSCFGIINDETSRAVVNRMTTQPGGGKGSGFIEDSKNFIRITSLQLL